MKLQSPVVLFLFSTVALTVSAQAVSSTEQLDEISVTALRDPTVYAKDQAQVTIIDKNQLSNIQPTSVAAAISNISNVAIEGGTRSLAQKPVIRGLGGNRVVQVIDGIRQNFELGHRGSYFLPTSILGQIEVVKGPSSTLWGSGALGGVVAMRTLNAFDLIKNNEKWGMKISQGYQSATSQSSTELALYGVNNTFDFLILPFYNKASNIRLGKNLGELPYSGLTQEGALLKTGWQINDEQRVELTARQTISKQLAPNNNEVFNVFTPRDFYNEVRNPSITDADRKRIYIKAGGTSDLSQQKIVDSGISLRYLLNPTSSLINSEFTLYTNQTKETESNQRTKANDETKYQTYGFNLRNSSEFERVALIYGLDFYQDFAKTIREKKEKDNDCIPTSMSPCIDLQTAKYRPNSYNAKNQVWGGYLLSHIQLTPKWIFSPSVRFDYYQTTEKKAKSYQKNHLSPAATLVYKPTAWLDLTTKYSEAFRAPSLQEKYTSGYHYGYNVGTASIVASFVENPNLKPEIARNKEINANFHWSNIWQTNDQLEFITAIFQNDIKDFINLEVISRTSPPLELPKDFQYRNVQNARLRGFEIEGRYKSDRWSSYISYGLLRAKNVQTNEYLNNINADKLIVGGEYSLVPTKFNIGAEIKHYFTQKRVPKNNEIYPGYTLVNLTATYAPESGEWNNLRIDFAIENLFDKAYQPAFSLTPGTGRNIKINLGYHF